MRYTDEGYVLRMVNILNEDKVIHLFLKEKGKIACIAKGVKKLTSRKASKLELLNLCKFSLAQGKNMDILLEVSVIQGYQTLKTNPSLLFIIFYLVELIDKTVYSGEVNNEMYQLLQEVLQIMDQTPAFPVYQILTYINGKVLLNLGVYPELYTCLVCKQKIQADDDKSISPQGISHTRCFKSEPISTDVIKALRFIATNDLQHFLKIKVENNMMRTSFALTTSSIEATIGFNIKSKAYIP